MVYANDLGIELRQLRFVQLPAGQMCQKVRWCALMLPRRQPPTPNERR